MRNYILSFLFLCIPCLTNAQEIQDEEYIVFADDNVKFICVKNWDTNGDGELSYSEAAAVTDIGTVFRWRNIYFFYELQYFTGLTSIGNEAFLGCSDLYSIQIPNSVSSIEDGAFQDCYGLTSIVIPNSVTSIGDEAFRDCTSLQSIVIPKSVTSIGYSTFADSSLRILNYCGTKEEWKRLDNNNTPYIPFECKVNYNYKGK